MGSWKVGIQLTSGLVYFEKISDGNTRGSLKSVSPISLAFNPEERIFETSGCSITFDNSDNYFDTLLNGVDKNIIGVTVVVYADSTWDHPIFFGQLRSISESDPTEFVIQCDYKTNGADQEMNTQLLKSDFPLIPEQNEGQWDNIIRGYIDNTGATSQSEETEVVINGDLEAWESAHVLTNWTLHSEPRPDSFTQETTIKYGGSSSCALLLYDGVGDIWASQRQQIALIKGVACKISLWYKTATGHTAAIALRNTASDVWLKSDGTWAGAETWIILPTATVWTNYSLNFYAHSSYDAYYFHFGNHQKDAVEWYYLYFDDLSVVTIGATKGMLVAFRVDTDTYWIGIGYVQIACYNTTGIDITGGCAYSAVTGLITYVSVDDYIYVCYSNAASTRTNPADMLRNLVSDVYHGPFDNLDGTTEYLAALLHFRNIGCEISGGTAMAITGPTTYRDWWTRMANNFDFFVYPYLSGDANYGTMYCDYNDLWLPALQYVAARTLLSTDIITGSYREFVAPNPLKCYDRAAREYWFQYLRGEEYFQRMPRDVDLASDWTAEIVYEDLRYIKHEQLAYKYAMRKLFFKNKPHFYCSFDIPLDKALAWGIVNLGKLLRLNYPLGYFHGTERVLKMTRLTINENEQTISLTCLDISHVVSKIKDIKLLILSHTTAGDTVFLDFSPKGKHVITAAGTMAHSSAWHKFHKSSMLGDGNSDYLTIPDSADWDLLVAANANFTIHSWWKTPAVLNAATNEVLIAQYVDGTHRWELNHQFSTHFMRLLINGTTVTSAIAFAASTVYHIAICKVGNNLGVYVNGIQWIYKDMTGIDTSLAEVLAIGARVIGGAPSLYCNWYFDEVAIIHDNLFVAAPNVGLTNTILIPEGDATWEGFNPWEYDADAFMIPIGLIIPYDSDAAIPTGWTGWTSADDRYLVAAGLTYPVADQGGSNDAVIATDVQGAHTGTATFTTNFRYESAHWNHIGQISAGGHAHEIGFNLMPARRNWRFIKSTVVKSKLPKNGIVFATSVLVGPTNVYSGDNKYPKPDVARSNAGNVISGINCSQAGLHTHADSEPGHAGLGYYATETLDALGLHNHPVSALTLTTENIKKMMVSAWTNAATDYNLIDNMIAMWESLVPPEGWALCDGTLGTLDLRDYFIMIGTTVNHGTTSGNNTITVADTIDNVNWNHGHVDPNYPIDITMPWGYSKHTTENVVHGHDLSNHSPAFVPKYYSVAFIQKIP